MLVIEAMVSVWYDVVDFGARGYCLGVRGNGSVGAIVRNVGGRERCREAEVYTLIGRRTVT